MQHIINILTNVCDPEVPVLSIIDLGIIQKIENDDDNLTITITPTYTGCPAMDVIATNIRMELAANGYPSVQIKYSLMPLWTTDNMTEAGKQKLITYGIAAPNKNYIIPADGIPCPKCESTLTKLVSEFGSTACKAHCQCLSCLEPFDYFKCY